MRHRARRPAVHSLQDPSHAAREALSAVAVQLCDVFRAAVVAGAPAIPLAHNHPSGECTPSPEDYAFTSAARRAGDLLGIKVLDHVVVASSGYYSLLDAGHIQQLPTEPA